MAAHRRRKSPAAAFRIALIVAANLAAAWFLWTLVHEPARASAADVGRSGRAGELAPRTVAPRAPSSVDSRATARLAALGARIREIVARAKRQAVKASGGRVDARTLHVAVHLRDPRTGAEFGLDAARALRPASNMKIVTTAAALTLLGSDWSFATPIEARGTLADGRLDGDLVLRAGGDPLFDPEAEGSIARLLAPALDELARSGLKRVSGRLILDEGTFDPPGLPPGSPGPDQRYFEYCALSGGFSANRGCVTVRVAPTSVGAPARIDVEPAGFGLERRFSAVTSAAGKLEVGFDARPTGLVVRGAIPRSSEPFVGSCPVPDPVLLFAGALRHELASRGIAIEGATVRERNAAPGRVLATIRTPLSDCLVPINQESNNAVADQLWLAMANSVTGNAARSSAEAASLSALERLRVSGDGFRQVDGSGLSDRNRASARQMTALLQAALGGDPRTAKLYRSSFAVAGVSGTLEKRMRRSPAKGRIVAKTGFIDGTSALSGVALTQGGGELLFSILVNYEEFGGLNTSAWKPMGDEICELLVGAEL